MNCVVLGFGGRVEIRKNVRKGGNYLMTLNLAYRLDLFRLSNPFPPTPELFQPIIICLKDITNKKIEFSSKNQRGKKTKKSQG